MWPVAGALFLLGELIKLIRNDVFSYLSYYWMSVLFIVFEAVMLIFAGLWLKVEVESADGAPASGGYGQNSSPLFRVNETISAKAQYDYNVRLNEFCASGAEISEETEAKVFAQAVELQTLVSPANLRARPRCIFP